MKIAELRKKIGMTQQQLCHEMNVDRSTVAKWETTSMPSADKLPKLAKLFGCSIDELFEERKETV